MRLTALAVLAIMAAVSATAPALLPMYGWVQDSSVVHAQQDNRVPEFPEGESAIRVVDEDADADEKVGEPLTAVDPGDILTYSLTGDDADDFTIDASTGQILTKSALDYATKGSYSVTVEVTDSADTDGTPDSVIDDTIAVTIRVSVVVDLGDWSQEAYESDSQYCDTGGWTIGDNGRAKETTGKAPSVLHGDFGAYGKRLTATLLPGNDDDFVGFVVGFNGGDATNANADYLLIDWKKQGQDWDFNKNSSDGGTAERGLRLSRVSGIPDCDEFWQHANLGGTTESNGVEQLQKAETKGDTDYHASQHYEFVLDFGSESIEVYLDGRLEFDLDGDFSDGSFGAYVMLHNKASFFDFSYTDGSFPSADQSGAVALSTTTPEVGVAVTATLTDADGGVENEAWQWQSSPSQDPAAWTAITGATAASYTPVTGDAGKLLRVTVVYDDADGSGRTASSGATAALDQKGAVGLSSGKPEVGVAVTATLTDADGGVTGKAWQWERSPDQESPAWVAITGASSDSYTPVADDAGKLLRASVTYDDATSEDRTAASDATAAVDQLGAVTLSSQNAVVGVLLTATLSDADGGVTGKAWQWERSPNQDTPDWVAITGATSASYTPVANDAGKLLRATVDYDDGIGTGRTASSGATARVDQQGAITLSSSVPDIGIAVTATLTDPDGSISSKTWQWRSSPDQSEREWDDISEAVSSSYTPVNGDEGRLLLVTVSYSDRIGIGRSATSEATSKVGKAGVVSLSSSAPVVGTKLTATLTDSDGGIGSEEWQWESSPGTGTPSWSVIGTATSASYTPVTGDAGKLLRVVVTYTDETGSGRMATSGTTAKVDQAGTLSLSSTSPVVGVTLTATLSDSDGGVTNRVWKWESSPRTGVPTWIAISAAKAGSYKPVTGDAGKLLRATVSYDDGTGTGRMAASVATTAVDQIGELTLSTYKPVVGVELKATLTDADGGVTGESWQWKRSSRDGTPVWAEIDGATSRTYTPTGDDGGKLLQATVTYNDAVGSRRGASSSSTTAVDRPGVVTLSSLKPEAGVSLTAALKDGDGDVRNERWQWGSSADQESPVWANITGAESASYTPSPLLAGKLLRATVVYGDATGSGRTAASEATAGLDRRGAVALSSGKPEVGVAVTATLTDADGSIVGKVWQWQRSPDQESPAWTAITGASSDSYTPVADDAGKLLRATVNYDDATGEDRTAASDATAAVDRRGAVSLSSPNAVVGVSLTATLTDEDGSITNRAWQWQSSPGTGDRDWSDITGATSGSYTPVADDAGKLLRATVSYDDGVGTGRTASSGVTARVDQQGAITLSSSVPDIGIALKATLTDPDGSISSKTWQWRSSPDQSERVWADISDATSSAYTPVTGDEGKLLWVTVSYGDGIGTGRLATSEATSKVGKAGVVSLSSSAPVVGTQLTATLTDLDGGVANKEWRWESSPGTGTLSWSVIVSETSASYMPVTGDAGKLLRVVVTYTDETGSDRMASSGASAKVDQAGTLNLSSGNPAVGVALKATLADSDGSITNQGWKWESSPRTGVPRWTAIAGATFVSYKPVAGDAGKLLRVTVGYDDGTGTGRTATSVATAAVDQQGYLTLSTYKPVVGVELTATLTDADGGVTGESWRWQRSPRDGKPAWADITGAESATLTPTADDGGKLLLATVVYDDTVGSGRGASSSSTTAVDRPGVVTLSSLKPEAGVSLTAALKDGDGDVRSERWQWESSADQDLLAWTDITGAESAGYTPSPSLAGKLLRVTVVYDDATGSARTAASEATAALDRRGAVGLSSGKPEVGVAVTATLTDPDGSIAAKVWQWQSSPSQDPPAWTAITGATAASYTPVTGDAGKLLRASVTYDDATGEDRTAASDATAEVDRRGAVSLSPSNAVVGVSLTATLADADGSIDSKEWQWQSSPGTGDGSWSDIAGATSGSYTPVLGDAGKLLRASVSYDDGIGTGRTASSGATARVDQRGSVSLSSAVPDIGIELTATLVDADGSITNHAWQWRSSPDQSERVWTDIAEATSSSYTPVTGDEGRLLQLIVSYGDATGTGRSATSAATSKVGKAGVVSLSSSAPVVGIEVSATLTDPDGGIGNKEWQWESAPGTGTPSWIVIGTATCASYTPVTGDAGKLLRVVVTYTDETGSGRMASSEATARVDQLGTVSLSSGSPVVGVALKATLADSDGSIMNQGWKWESSPRTGVLNWTAIAGATFVSYKPVTGDAGKLLQVTVTYDDGTGTGRMAASMATAAVDQPGEVSLSTYKPVVGVELTATLTDADGGITEESWQWQRSARDGKPVWAKIDGATSASYTPTADDGGELLQATVTYDDDVGSGRGASSSSTTAVDRPGVVTLSSLKPEAGVSLTAALKDGDGDVRNERWQWESSADQESPVWAEVAGAESASYTPSPLLAGKLLRVTVVYDDATGLARTAASEATAALDQRGAVGLSSGKPEVGVALTATLTDADGSIAAKVWQWQMSPDQEAPVWVAITGATSASYTPVADDAGKLLRATVTYDDATGEGRTATSDVTAAVDQLGAVTLSSQNAVVGVELTATLVDDDGSVANGVWQWQISPGIGERSWSDISGATSGSYTPVTGDAGKVLRATVSYDDGIGTGRTASSGATARVDQLGTITLRSSVPDIGISLTATLTDLDGSITNHAWQWRSSPDQSERVWTDIAGATSLAYTPVAGDEGKLLQLIVSYGDATGTGRSATSEATSKVGKAGVVSLSPSAPVVGTKLTATLTDPDGGIGTKEWQWESSPGQDSLAWAAITGATSASYTPVTGDAGKLLRVVATYTDETGSDRMASSGASAKVDQAGTLSLSSTSPVVGVAVKATLADADGSIANRVWKWESSPRTGVPNWTAIGAAKSAGYKPVTGDAGKLLRVTVVYDDGTGTGRTATSVATAAVDQLGGVSLSTYKPVVGVELTAILTDADGGVTEESWQWRRSSRVGKPDWAEIDGATSAAYTPTDDDGGKLLQATVSYDDTVGIGRSASSPSTTAVDRPGVVTLSSLKPEADVRLTATLKDGDGDIRNKRWQWGSSADQDLPAWTDITGAESDNYTPSPSLAGKLLRVTVVYDDATGSGRTAVSEATAALDQRGELTLSTYKPVVGIPVTATLSDADGGVTGESWQWRRSLRGGKPVWADISGAESATYTPTDDDGGKLLQATVSYDDAVGSGRSAASPSTTAVELLSQTIVVSLPTGLIEVDEGAGVVRVPITFTFTGTAPTASGVYVVYGQLDTGHHTALLNSDWEYDPGLAGERVSTGAMPFGALMPTRTLHITLPITDDSEIEGDETFAIGISSPVRLDPEADASLMLALGASSIIVTIRDNDKDEQTTTTTTGGGAVGPNFPPAFDEREAATREVEIGRPGALVGTPVVASDTHGDKLGYVLTGEDAALFYVDLDGGQISIAKTVAYLMPGVYRVTLLVIDYKGGVDSIDVTIMVMQLTIPAFVEGDTTERKVRENAPAGTAVGAAIEAIDHDGDTLTYSLTQDDEAAFLIETGTGQIRTLRVFDRESRSAYAVTVGVDDGRGGRAQIGVSIRVSDVNEGPVFGNMGTAVLTIDEDSPSGSLVGEPIAASDPEGDALVFSLWGDGAYAFDIDAATGQMTAKAPLDYEGRSSYLVSLRVEDGRGGVASVYITIKVADVKEESSEAGGTPGDDTSEGASMDGDHLGNGLVVTPSEPSGKGSLAAPDLETLVGEDGTSTAGPETLPEQQEDVQGVVDGDGMSLAIAAAGVPDAPMVRPTSPAALGAAASLALTPTDGLALGAGDVPLWQVLLMAGLPYVNGIVLISIVYRVWGRPA